MKKLSAFFCMALFPVVAVAQAPTRSQVGTAARIYMQVMNGEAPGAVECVYKNAIEGATGLSISTGSMMNVLQYKQGGWVLMSNDLRVQPVLAYSSTGVWENDTSQMPPALVELLCDYIEQITKIKTSPQAKSEESEFYQENKEKWMGLQSETSSYVYHLTQSKASYVAPLLVDEKGYSINWGQLAYAYGESSPKYNKFAPSGCGSDILYTSNKTGHKPIGCSSVAMGQLMKYWKFPPQYDWEKMPARLYSSSSVQDENNIAHLLRDCADKASVNFLCEGSWTTTNKIVTGMQEMYFSESNKKTKGDKDDGDWWPDLIKKQLNNGWPVIYRGDKCDLCSSKHFWVVDGYNKESHFHCNWGWSGGYNGYYDIHNLKWTYTDSKGNEQTEDFRKNNMVVRDIYPDWNVSEDWTKSNITKGNDEELRAFCKNASMKNITLKGNSQSKIAFTGSLVINGPFEVSGDATLTLACYDKELAAQLQKGVRKSTRKNEEEDEENNFTLIREEKISATSDLFVLSPNPAKNEVQISMATYESGNEGKEVEIFDYQGRLRYTTQFIGGYIVLPIESLRQGMYFVRVTCRENRVTQKLVVR